MSKNRGLGRGFDSLIPTELDISTPVSPAVAPSSDAVLQIAPGKISPNPHQPRTHFEEADLKDLADSIKQHGVLQPLVVSDRGDGQYELIAGERRLRASKLAGLETVPVIVRSFSQQQKLELALIENIQRANLNPIETALAYKKLGIEFNLTLDQIGERVGKAKSTVSNAMRLLQLPRPILDAIATGKISEAHGRTLLAVEDPQKQHDLLDNIIEQGLTVRQLEERVREERGNAADNIDDNPKAGRPAKPVSEMNYVAKELADYLGTKVSLQASSQGGRLVIDYASDEQLKEIAGKINSGS